MTEMVRAKKHYGQNFLNDISVINKIIQAIPKNIDEIVEVGPGLGDLTLELLKIAKVKAYEIDKELVVILENKFKALIDCGKLELLNKDVAETFEDGLSENKYFLVANLPYYMASKIIMNTLKDENCLGLIVMVQKELALKFCANEKNKEFGAISVLTSLICERKVLFDVKPECFNPQPKVMSSVIKLEKKFEYKEICNIELFQIFLKDCFKAPRKKLVSNLNIDNKLILKILNILSLKENIRPHEVSVNSYIKIFNYVKENYERKYYKQ